MNLKVKEYVFSPALDKKGVEKKYSDDAIFISDNAVAIFDGATGLSNRRIMKNGDSDASWLSNTAVKSMEKIADFTNPSPEIAKQIIANIITEYEKNRYDYDDIKIFEQPSSTMLMVKKSKKEEILDLLLVADGTLMWQAGGDFSFIPPSEFLSSRGADLDKHIVEMLASGKSLLEAKNIMMDNFKQVRCLMNTPEAYGVLTLDYAVISHKDFKPLSQKFKTGDMILLASDGLTRFFDTYNMGNSYDFFNLAKNSLQDLKNMVRDFEKSDINCEKLPRFKASDDISAVMIEVV